MRIIRKTFVYNNPAKDERINSGNWPAFKYEYRVSSTHDSGHFQEMTECNCYVAKLLHLN